jgi:hypothetical protein
MDCAALETSGESDRSAIFTPEYDFAGGIVVRHYADDDVAIKKLSDVRRRLKVERLKFMHEFWAANISDHMVAGIGEICSDGRTHAAEADKTDVT